MNPNSPEDGAPSYQRYSVCDPGDYPNHQNASGKQTWLAPNSLTELIDDRNLSNFLHLLSMGGFPVATSNIYYHYLNIIKHGSTPLEVNHSHNGWVLVAQALAFAIANERVEHGLGACEQLLERAFGVGELMFGITSNQPQGHRDISIWTILNIWR